MRRSTLAKTQNKGESFVEDEIPAINARAPEGLAFVEGDYWADLDADHDVDGKDLHTLSAVWNCAAGQDCYVAEFDRDNDGDIDVFDLAALGNEYDNSGPAIEIVSPAYGDIIGGGNVSVSGYVEDVHAVDFVSEWEPDKKRVFIRDPDGLVFEVIQKE